MTISQCIFTLNNKLKKLNAEDIMLLAVTKAQSTESIKEAYTAGIRNFGESYWQEAQAKIKDLTTLDIIWHFIGHIQSNKIKHLANSFFWIHSIDKYSQAELFSKHRSQQLPPLNICIQVNLDSEPQKSGILPDDLENLVSCILQLPRLKLRGLMAVPKKASSKEAQFQSFLRLRVLLESINQKFSINLDSLSMGMTDDYEEAIRAGSTIIRIGRAIFGERES